MFMFLLNILGHNLLGTNRPESWVELIEGGCETSEPGCETSEPGHESSGYERSMGAKRLVSGERKCLPLSLFSQLSQDLVYSFLKNRALSKKCCFNLGTK